MSATTVIPADLVHELHETLAEAAKGFRDPEKMRKASEEMDRLREELRLRIGTVEVAVDLVRTGRDERCKS
jgi:hypothetical protein